MTNKDWLSIQIKFSKPEQVYGLLKTVLEDISSKDEPSAYCKEYLNADYDPLTAKRDEMFSMRKKYTWDEYLEELIKRGATLDDIHVVMRVLYGTGFEPYSMIDINDKYFTKKELFNMEVVPNKVHKHIIEMEQAERMSKRLANAMKGDNK